MKNSVFMLALLLLVFSNNINSQVTQEWAARYNGPGNNIDYAYAIAIDGIGNVYVTGWSFSAGSGYDYATVKYSPAGIQQWVQRYNGPGNGDDKAYSIAVDLSGNVIISGYSFGNGTGYDYATVKYNSSGVQQWAIRYNGAAGLEDYTFSMAVDNLENVYVTGSSNTTSSGYDYATVKYNSSGVQQWAEGYNGPANGSDEASAITVDGAGNVFVTGTSSNPIDYVTIKYSSSGTQQWVQRYNWAGSSNDYAKSITLDNQGNAIVTGSTYSNSSLWNYATVKYNSSGIEQWDIGYYGTEEHNWSDEHAHTVAADGSGNIFVTGASTNSPQPFDFAYATCKYNPSGTSQWVRRYDGPVYNGEDISYSVAASTNGDVYLTGSSLGSGSGLDYLTLKYNASGVQQWEQRYSGPGTNNDIAYKIAIDNSGNIYITGWSMGNGSDYDFVTIKYSQLVGIQPISNEIPHQYSLSQNYPNPFNPSTKIKFAIPVGNGRDRSLIKIYDALGREISTLVNEELNPGTYEVDWNAVNYPSGVYYYKLTSKDYTETKKMILIK
jgi:uncharacterized delta-60 repeat protein